MFHKFLFPSERNNYYPYSIRKSALVLYTLLLFLFNVFSGVLLDGTSAVYASNISQDNIIALVNRERENAGMNKLKHDSRLTAAAKAKAADMLKKDYWDHFGPNGETPWQFITASGYGYIYAGENLAKGFSTSEGVHQAWMASPTHKANIMNKNYADIGVAVVEGTLQGQNVILVVQMFGATSTVQQPKTQTTTTPKVNTAPTTTQPIPTNTPPKVETGQIKSISIERPVDGETVTDPTVDIEGSVTGFESNMGSYTVVVRRGDTEITSSQSSASEWSVDKRSDWEEGEQSLVVSVLGLDSITDEVVFFVDSTAPVFVRESVSLKVVNNHAELSLFVDESDATVLLNYGNEIYAFAHEGDGVFTAFIPRFIVTEPQFDALLSLSDSYGNTREVNISELIQELHALDSNLVPVASQSVLGSVFGGLLSLDTRAKVNLGFALALLFVLALQIYLYRKKGMLNDKGGYLMTIGVFTLLVLIGTFSEVGGSIGL